MNFILTPKEYEEKKKEILTKLDSFIQDYNEFVRKTSSGFWRSAGSYSTELTGLKEDIPKYKPLTMKELEIDWVRNDILNDQEKEEWNTMKKYNL